MWDMLLLDTKHSDYFMLFRFVFSKMAKHQAAFIDVLICYITPVTQSTHKPSLIGVLGQVYGCKHC